MLKTPPNNVQVGFETITPDMAARMLENNPRNRSVRPDVVTKYAKDLKSGSWQMTGDTIKFDRNDALLDGQHRLYAIITSKKPMETVVVRGLDPNVIENIDNATGRTPADVLKILGFKYSIISAATARWLASIKYNSPKASSITRTMILDFAHKHQKGIEESAAWYYRLPLDARGAGPTPAMLVTMHYIGSKLLKKPKVADAFMGVFETGDGTYTGDPARKLREHLMRKKFRHEPIHRYEHMYGTIWAWNKFVLHRPGNEINFDNQIKINGLDLKRI